MAESQRQVSFEGAVSRRVYVASRLSEFIDRNNRQQRRVLNQGNELPDHRRQGKAQGLGEDDIPIGLRASETDGFGRFDLRFAYTLDAGADDFAHVSPAETGKNEDAGKIAIGDVKSFGDDIKENQNLDQQRSAAND